jgi:hypothetical protein
MDEKKELTGNEKSQIVGDICKMITERTEQIYHRIQILQSVISLCTDSDYLIVSKRQLFNEKS